MGVFKVRDNATGIIYKTKTTGFYWHSVYHFKECIALTLNGFDLKNGYWSEDLNNEGVKATLLRLMDVT